MTQASPDCVKPRSALMEGRATFTTVASRTIMSMPTHRTISAAQRLAGGAVGVEVAVICSYDRVASANSSVVRRLGPMDLEAALDGLYAVPPAEFVAERKRVVQ